MGYFLYLFFLWFVVHKIITGIGEQNEKAGNAILMLSPLIGIGIGVWWFYNLSSHTGKGVPLTLFFLAIIFVFQAARKRF
ncbi:hypothetical protein [Bordetella trematum]|uniref:hypothetical protein n=1 Tax=Bordetella trematum TaxID=123899 RepID=UPI003AF3D052